MTDDHNRTEKTLSYLTECTAEKMVSDDLANRAFDVSASLAKCDPSSHWTDAQIVAEWKAQGATIDAPIATIRRDYRVALEPLADDHEPLD